jgi:predicted dehydrogenase
MASRVAIVGLGMAVTPHAKSLLDLKDRASVAYAYSPTRERRAKFAERFDFPLTDRLDIIAADPTVDAVLILTPPNTHLGLVERFAAAGKHILLEKPLEITLERSERLVAAAGNVTLGVVLQHRFRPAAAKLHDIVESGRLGKLVSASASIPNWRPQSYYDQPGRGTKARDGGGVLLTQGIHTLDLLCWYAGEATDARSLWTTTSVHRMETEDLACAALRFSSGALGTVHATTTAYPGFPERIELIGRKGTALLEGTSLRAQFMDGTSEELKSDAGGGGTGADPMAFPHDWHRELLVDFLDAIEKRRAPRSSGAETLKVHRLIDRILRSGD